MATDDSEQKQTHKSGTRERRHQQLSPGVLARLFHQPALIYFNAVAEHGSIREASRQLNVASSAVTRQVAQLEDSLGMPLFLRDRRRLRLSAAGETLFRHARRLIAPMEAAVSELEMLRGIKTGTVRIACVESVGASFLHHLLSDFSALYPTLHLEIAVTSSQDVIDRIEDERADVGLGFIAETPKNIDIMLRRDLRIGALMTPTHPLASKSKITLEDCLAHPIAIATKGISIRDVVEPFLKRAGALPGPMLETNSIRLLVQLAETGHHVSISTIMGAQAEIAAKKLIFRPLADPGLPINQFGILVRSLSQLHFAPAVFYEHARAFFEKTQFPEA